MYRKDWNPYACDGVNPIDINELIGYGYNDSIEGSVCLGKKNGGFAHDGSFSLGLWFSR